MTPEEAVLATRDVITGLAANFMLDGETYKRGAALGFDGVDFYVAGRGGVLGSCDADVVSAAFMWFNPEHIRRAWEKGLAVMPPAASAEEFAGCCHRWAEAHMGEGVDAARLAELAGRIVDGSSPAGAPVFAGWRRLPVPSDPKMAAVHQLNALRELRAALHGGAVLATGLAPEQAMAVSSPYMAQLFGWDELPAADAAATATWERGEQATNAALATRYAVLSATELDEFTALANGFAATKDA